MLAAAIGFEQQSNRAASNKATGGCEQQKQQGCKQQAIETVVCLIACSVVSKKRKSV
jgi:hypothetical protein